MALQGTLDTFALADLVQLLASTQKTGELMIEGDRGSGRLWFLDGALVGGEPESAAGATATIFELLRFKEGSFVFEPDRSPAEPTDAVDAPTALAEAQARIEIWGPVEALLPTPDVALSLAPALPSDEVTVDQDTWRLLVAVGGGTTFGSFGTDVELSEYDAGLTVKALVDEGLVVIDEPVEEATPSEPVDEAVEVEPAEVEAAEVEPVEVEPAGTDEDDTVDDISAIADAEGDVDGDTAVAVVDVDEVVADGFILDELPEDPEVAPITDPSPEIDLDPAAGSLAVDLDHTLGGAADDHHYIANATDGSTLLPEPLPTGDGTEVGLAGADDVDPTSAWTGDDADLAMQLESLSPQAAAAVAAAAADTGGDEGNEEGRRVLRRIIHKS